MIMYLSQANLTMQHKTNNEILAYFLDEKMAVCFRFENPLESYIIFNTVSNKVDFKQDMQEDWESGEYQIISGELDE